MPLSVSQEWGLQTDITPHFGARLVQEGNRLHYLADRAGMTGSFTPEKLQKLDQAFPLYIEQLEAMLRSGELNPRQQHQRAVHLAGLTYIAAKDVYEDEFFSIRYFQKGSAHLTFKRPELIERMNDIIARHYPGMLAQR